MFYKLFIYGDLVELHQQHYAPIFKRQFYFLYWIIGYCSTVEGKSSRTLTNRVKCSNIKG